VNKQLGWAALVLCGLSLLLIAALTALHDPVPDVLNLVAIGSLTGGASLAVPGGTETIRTVSSSSSSPATSTTSRPSGATAAPVRVPVQSSGPNGSTPVGAP
jgi:hypothetical protein